MSANLETILATALNQLGDVKDLTQLDNIRVQYLGKKGEFTQQMKELGKLDPEQRRVVGQLVNDARDQFQARLDNLKIVLEQQALDARLAAEMIDVTLPGRGQVIAGLHPVSITLRRINQIFASVGFNVVEGLKSKTTIITLKH